jgi:hypothetical protein
VCERGGGGGGPPPVLAALNISCLFICNSMFEYVLMPVGASDCADALVEMLTLDSFLLRTSYRYYKLMRDMVNPSALYSPTYSEAVDATVDYVNSDKGMPDGRWRDANDWLASVSQRALAPLLQDGKALLLSNGSSWGALHAKLSGGDTSPTRCVHTRIGTRLYAHASCRIWTHARTGTCHTHTHTHTHTRTHAHIHTYMHTYTHAHTHTHTLTPNDSPSL